MIRDIYASFDAFYQRHSATLIRKLISGYWVLHPIRGKRSRPGIEYPLAEEVCQQVWTEMWEHILAGKQLSAILLYQRADSRLIDHFRHVRRFRHLGENQMWKPTGISRDEVLDIQQFVSGLPHRDRAIVTDWLHGHTIHEIAERNGIHPNTATNILRNTKQMNIQVQDTTTKKTKERVIAALPGTPAGIARKTGISRETIKKQLQRLLKAGSVMNDEGTYSLALAPTDTTILVATLRAFLDKLDRKEIKIVPYRFDDKAIAEHDMPMAESRELPTKEPRRNPTLESSEREWTDVNLPTAEPTWSRI